MSFFQKNDRLEQLGTEVIDATRAQFPNLARDRIALTWIVYDSPVIANTGGAMLPDEFWAHPVRGFNYRGLERIYPASVVKLFYLVAMHEWLETNMIAPSAEGERAMRDAIADSSNDATSLLLDLLTGTTSGPELPPGPFETWKFQRNLVNRYYQSLGWPELEGINVNQKTWSDGPYGRERAFVGELMDNRNMLTSDAVARLLHAIVGGVAVSGARSQAMMKLLERNLSRADATLEPGEENQVKGFLGEGLPGNAKLWSKAGWTSRVRHDAGYIEIPNLSPYLLVVLTEGQGNNAALLPFISEQIVKAMANVS